MSFQLDGPDTAYTGAQHVTAKIGQLMLEVLARVERGVRPPGVGHGDRDLVTDQTAGRGGQARLTRGGSTATQQNSGNCTAADASKRLTHPSTPTPTDTAPTIRNRCAVGPELITGRIRNPVPMAGIVAHCGGDQQESGPKNVG
jgi:hypothetical protein